MAEITEVTKNTYTQYVMPHMQIKPKSMLRKCDSVGRETAL